MSATPLSTLVSAVSSLRGNPAPKVIASVSKASTSAGVVIMDQGLKKAIEIAFMMQKNGGRPHIQLFGNTGSGKSTIARHILETKGRTFLRIQCTKGMDSEELIGCTIADPDSASGFSFQWGALVEAAIHGWTVILEEIDSLNPDKSFHLFPLLDDSPEYSAVAQGHKRQIIKHQDFMVIATSNTNGSGEGGHLFVGTEIMNQALIRRFIIKYEVPYLGGADESKLLVAKTGVPKNIADSMTAIASGSRNTTFRDQGGKPISTAHLIGFAQAWVANSAMPPAQQLRPIELAGLTFILEYPTEMRKTLEDLVRNKLGA